MTHRSDGGILMREKLQQWMYGRHGADELNKFLLYIAITLMIINLFTKNHFINTCTLILLIICYFRMFSKNHKARYDENIQFLRLKNKFLIPLQNLKFGNKTFKDKTYKIFKCPSCKQKVRVPKGKGKISIHCPKCNTDFIKRT